jgi:hypothetical protein
LSASKLALKMSNYVKWSKCICKLIKIAFNSQYKMFYTAIIKNLYMNRLIVYCSVE